MNNVLQYILTRLKEPSTWAGLALFIGMFGLDADLIGRITANGPAIITAIGALVAILAPGSLGMLGGGDSTTKKK